MSPSGVGPSASAGTRRAFIAPVASACPASCRNAGHFCSCAVRQSSSPCHRLKPRRCQGAPPGSPCCPGHGVEPRPGHDEAQAASPHPTAAGRFGRGHPAARRDVGHSRPSACRLAGGGETPHPSSVHAVPAFPAEGYPSRPYGPCWMERAAWGIREAGTCCELTLCRRCVGGDGSGQSGCLPRDRQVGGFQGGDGLSTPAFRITPAAGFGREMLRVLSRSMGLPAPFAALPCCP